MRWSTRWLAVLLLLGCKKAPPAPEAATAPATAQEARVEFSEAKADSGLTMRLFEAQPQKADAAGARVATAQALDAATVDARLARLPAMKEEAQAVDFALREGPQPPPRAGASVQVEFPGTSAEPPPAAEAGPLSLLRRAPEGEVPMAPHLSLSFSQPMIALQSQEEAAAQVPVRLSPEVPGRWSWLGTKTLVFRPTGRFPMATEFQVEVPAGTRATSGATMEAQRWSFATPPVTLQSSWPDRNDPQPLSPVIFLGFDQAVDPAAIAAVATVEAGRDRRPLRVATAEELAASATASARMKAAEPGRGVALVPTSPLGAQTTWRVLLPAGTPSAEGPRKTTTEQSFWFRTHGPMTVAAPRCWRKPCPPDSAWSIPFSNPIGEDFDPASIRVEPAVPGLQMNPSGKDLSLWGLFTGRSTYTVHVAAGVPDVFGQRLAEPASFSIEVGPADPSFSGPESEMVVVDPAGGPELSFFTVNRKGLRVRVQRVSPEDWAAWMTWQQRYRWEDARKDKLPGTRLAELTVPVESKPDARVETRVDLGPWLKNGSGQLLLHVEPTDPPKDKWSRMEWIGWVQVTKIGLTAFADSAGVTGWATDLRDGRPLAGVDLSLLGGRGAATVDADGLGRVALTEAPATGLVARLGDDLAFLPASTWYWGGGWVRVEQMEQLRWFVFDDKHLYKPGETVHLRGIFRRWDPADQELHTAQVAPIRWEARSSQGNPIASGSVQPSGLGGFSFEIPLPATPNLGTAWVTLSTEMNGRPWSMSHAFDIQEYRTPEFEVATSGGDGVYTLGEDAFVDVSAKYYAGGGLPSAEVRWNLSATPASFTPPGRSDWSFGPWAPWWAWWEPPASTTNRAQLESLTDSQGDHHLGIHFEALDPARPMTVTAEASVQDVNRQTWSSSRTFLVHPAEVYVGLRAKKTWVEAKKPIEVEVLRVDRAGKEVAGGVELVLRRLEWKRVGREWKETSEDVDRRNLDGATGSVSFSTEAGGQFAVVATTRDGRGRRNQSELRVWVSGGGPSPDRGVDAERVSLIPDQQRYEVGQTARIAIQAPFWPAEAVISTRAGRLLGTQRITLRDATTEFELPIEARHMPDLSVAVDVVGSRTRSDDDGHPRTDLPPRVSYGSGSVSLQVSTASRKLGVKLRPALARLDPGAGTQVLVDVTDPDGRPVPGAELSVIAVDEAVLALGGYQLPDPLAVFYAARGDGVASHHLRQWVRLVDPGTLGGLGATGTGEGGGGMLDLEMDGVHPQEEAKAERGRAEPVARAAFAAAPPPAPPPPPGQAPAPSTAKKKAEAPDDSPIAVRTDFAALALWAPSVTTDAAGHATVDLKLPDSLTRYRIMVVAMAGERLFGTGESDVTARLPLMVRPSPPRFLNFGDRFELPVVLQNQTDAPLSVDLVARSSNLLLTDSVATPFGGAGSTRGGRRVTVPANDRVELRLPAAAVQAGTARVQLAAVSGSYADAAEVELPVWTPATTEAFATYGSFEQGVAVQPVKAPAEVWPQFGGLEVTVSSTQLQALTEAVVYLVKYPFECNEQRASRVLAVAALRDVLDAFHSAELPPKERLEASIAEDLAALGRRQNPDGGWAFWRRGDPGWPYLGVHVTHALVRAKDKGYAVDSGMYGRALSYVANIEAHLPRWYSKESKWAIRAYALHVRSLAGQKDVARARALYKEAGADGLGPLGLGWLLPTLVEGKAPEVADVRLWLANHVTESAAGAHFVSGYSDGAQVLLHSDRVADGVLLEAMLRTAPKDELIPKLVNGLLAHRRQGRWANTTENAQILLALDRYFHLWEGTTPDFLARVWLGTGYAGDHAFRGRSTERAQIDVPMRWLAERPGDLVLAKDGPGRLYYRLGLRYAPKDLEAEAADHGFTVRRRYEGVDDPADVRQESDGSWTVRAGARVRVKLEMVTPMRRYHVALVDPMPAGFEVQNPELKTTGALPEDPEQQKGPWWWWQRAWFEHENLRDERVEAFSSLLYDGVYDYSYIALATTPGDFVVPPAKAEEMYSPETFGRSGGDRVVVR